MRPLLREVFAQADRRLRPGAAIYVASAYGPMMLPFIQEFVAAGWNHSATLAWVKNQMSYGGAAWIGGYRNQHEAILYGWKRGARAFWAGGYDQSAVIDDEPAAGHLTREELLQLIKDLRNDRQTDVVREDKARHNDLHPTMKPIPLIRRMLANSSEPSTSRSSRSAEVPAGLVRPLLLGGAAPLLAPGQVGSVIRRVAIAALM